MEVWNFLQLRHKVIGSKLNEVDYTALGLKKIKVTISILDICITLLTIWVP